MNKMLKLMLASVIAFGIQIFLACSEGGTVIDPNTMSDIPKTCEKGPGKCGPVYIETFEKIEPSSVQPTECTDSTNHFICPPKDVIIDDSKDLVDSLSGFDWERDSLVKEKNISIISMSLDSMEKAFTICNTGKLSFTQILNLEGDLLKLYLKENLSENAIDDCVADSLAFAENCNSLNGTFRSERHNCASGDLLVSCFVPQSLIGNSTERKELFVKESIQKCSDRLP